MSTNQTIITTNWRIAGVIPPTPEYRWNKNVHVCVLADTITEAILKFSVAYPEAKIVSVNKASNVHIV